MKKKKSNSSVVSIKGIEDNSSEEIKGNTNWFAVENIKLRNKIKNLKIKYEQLQRNLGIKYQLLKNKQRGFLTDNIYLKLDKLLNDKKIRKKYKNSLIQTDITFSNNFFLRWNSYFDDCEIKKISSDSEIKILKKKFFKKSLSEFKYDKSSEKKLNDSNDKKKKEKNENKSDKNMHHDINNFSSTNKESSSNSKVQKHVMYKNQFKCSSYTGDDLVYIKEVTEEIKDEIDNSSNGIRYICSKCKSQTYLDNVTGDMKKIYYKIDYNNSENCNALFKEKKKENFTRIKINYENIVNTDENYVDKSCKVDNLQVHDGKASNETERRDTFHKNIYKQKNANAEGNEEFNDIREANILKKRNKNNEIKERNQHFVNLNEKNIGTDETSSRKCSVDKKEKQNNRNEHSSNNINYNKNEVITKESNKMHNNEIKNDEINYKIWEMNNKHDLNNVESHENKNRPNDKQNLNNRINGYKKRADDNYCNSFTNSDTSSVFSKKKKKIEVNNSELNGNRKKSSRVYIKRKKEIPVKPYKRNSENKDNFNEYHDKNIILNSKGVSNIKSNYMIKKEYFAKNQNLNKNTNKLGTIRYSKSLQEVSCKFPTKKERYIDILLKNITKNKEEIIASNNYKKTVTEYSKNISILYCPLNFKNQNKESFKKSSTINFIKNKNASNYSSLNNFEKKIFNTAQKLSEKKKRFYNNGKYK